MSSFVVDASAFVDLILGIGCAPALRDLMRSPDAEFHIPAVCDVEFVSAMRKRVLLRMMSVEEAERSIDDYASMPLARHGHELLIGGIFALRDAFTAYDAAYVALAEALDAGFVTSDRRLARAVLARASIEVFPS